LGLSLFPNLNLHSRIFFFGKLPKLLWALPPFLPKLNFKGALDFFLAFEENPEYLIAKNGEKVKPDMMIRNIIVNRATY